MIHRTVTLARRLVAPCFVSAAIGLNLSADARDHDTGDLQQLLYREALFYSLQQEHLSALTRLEAAEAQNLDSPSSAEARLLLARLKLAYGLHLEAGFELHAVPEEGVAVDVRNRSWYELARAFFHKGYKQAAADALASIEGEVPTDIAGDYQLLNATVLMSLDRNREAAEALEHWQGASRLAAYAHYNRGIALLRAGERELAVPILEMAVNTPARGEEMLALRDKARLSLGYTLAGQGEYRSARRQLEAVRPEGPFSNRALLALGWIAHKQGQSDSALVSWTELSGRSPIDPVVLETLLLVPTVQRELDALPTASRDYETAVSAYTRELDRLHAVRESVQQGSALSELLENENHSRPERANPSEGETARYFGPLLASRDFSAMQQGHKELQGMLESVDRSLQGVDVVAQDIPPAKEIPPLPELSPAQQTVKVKRSGGGGLSNPGDQGVLGEPGQPHWKSQKVDKEGAPVTGTSPGIPGLPDIESPERRAVKPLPRSGPYLITPPANPDSPPPPAPLGLAGRDIIWLPTSGEFFNRPTSGEFFRRPGELVEEDYAYPDTVPVKQRESRGRDAYRVDSMLPAPEETTGFDPGAIPVGEALRELAVALNNSSARVARLGEFGDPDAGLEERSVALRQRILVLRTRIANAIALYEDYAQDLALEELDRRQHLLEALLQQASLELAKTYDRTSDDH